MERASSKLIPSLQADSPETSQKEISSQFSTRGVTTPYPYNERRMFVA